MILSTLPAFRTQHQRQPEQPPQSNQPDPEPFLDSGASKSPHRPGPKSGAPLGKEPCGGRLLVWPWVASPVWATNLWPFRRLPAFSSARY